MWDDASKEEKKPDIAAGMADQKSESPWDRPRVYDDPASRVVGWANGSGITRSKQEHILRTDKGARREYLDAKKAIAGSTESSSVEPLAGLPASWQAFWATVPELDAQAAFRLHTKEKEKREQESKRKVAMEEDASLLPAADGSETLDEEMQRLQMELRKRKEVLASKKAAAEDWERKLNRVRLLDKEEDEDRRRVSRRLDKASYAHGVLQGKLRSSDQYFHFLYEDTKVTHSKKMSTLNKANAMMLVQINEMKGDVRQLLKVAAEMMHSSKGDSTRQPSREVSLKVGDAGAGEEAGAKAPPAAADEASGKPAAP